MPARPDGALVNAIDAGYRLRWWAIVFTCGCDPFRCHRRLRTIVLYTVVTFPVNWFVDLNTGLFQTLSVYDVTGRGLRWVRGIFTALRAAIG